MPGKAKDKKAKAVSGQTSGAYAPAAWGQSGLHDVDVPSGGTVLARLIGPTEMLRSGMLNKVDILSSIIQSDHIDRVEGRTETESEREARTNVELANMLKDPDQVLALMESIDALTIQIVVKPKIHAVPVPIPDPGGMIDPDTNEPMMVMPDRILGEIYVDSIPMDDKMFLFQWAMGGTRDLEAFRKGLGQHMDAISAVQDGEVSAE